MENDNDEIWDVFNDVGIYGITIQYNTVHKYRYVTKYPAISRIDFQQIVDDLIAECDDIDYIIRVLENKGFKVLNVNADLNYTLR